MTNDELGSPVSEKGIRGCGYIRDAELDDHGQGDDEVVNAFALFRARENRRALFLARAGGAYVLLRQSGHTQRV